MPSSVLLVDWPNQDVPRALLAAGCSVLSANFARGTASAYELLGPADPPPVEGAEVLQPDRAGDDALVIRRLDAMPSHVDAVAVFRPDDEHEAIARRAVDLRAQLIWVQMGHLSDPARHIADQAGMVVIENVTAPDAAQRLATIS